MADKAVLDLANDLLDRLCKIDEELQNAWCFRFLIEDLHSRDLEAVPRRHHDPIRVVRGAALRSLIASVMATLDPPDRRGNRASIGQIMSGLENGDVQEVLKRSRHRASVGGDRSLEQVRSTYDELKSGELFVGARALRNEALSHLLSMDEPAPSVPYETVYELQDRADAMVTDLFHICGRKRNRSKARMPGFREATKLFWDTYFKGMAG